MALLVNMPSFIKHDYSGTIYPTLFDTFLPWHHLNLSPGPIFSPLDSVSALPVCVCSCSCMSLVLHIFVHVCVCVMRKMLNEVL